MIDLQPKNQYQIFRMFIFHQWICLHTIKKNADLALLQCLKKIIYLYSIFEILILIPK